VISRKRLILEKSLISETRVLFRRLLEIARSCRDGLDLSRGALLSALKGILAAFPVYRSYLEEQSEQPSAADEANVRRALARAREADPELDAAAAQFIENLLLLRFPPDLDEAGRQNTRQFVMRFQQLSGPATAKGLEDTAFYNYFLLVSLNEVGGEPDKFGVSPQAFHSHNQRAAAHWPHTLLATATHDTKRGEDARARINVLSEMPQRWREAVTRWSNLNAHLRAEFGGGMAPDRNDEFLFYQALVGAWTSDCREAHGLDQLRERLSAYLLKAIREAKRHTTWTEPNEAYENAIQRFVQETLSPSANEFLDHFQQFHQDLAFYGVLNSLAQTALKLLSPGVPDTYQGAELWDFSLVDPDNRRPVDYGLRRRLLEDLRRELPLDSEGWPLEPESTVQRIHLMLANPEAGQVKLWLIWRLLALRRRLSDLFENCDYIPLNMSGAWQQHLCGFARTGQGKCVIIVVPRLIYGLTAGEPIVPLGQSVWKDTAVDVSGLEMHGKSLRNWLTGEELPGAPTLSAAQLLSSFPLGVVCSG
jgi:(1->4)-alpha-D-glucan 1-alpha-D-glucosylmutase